MASKRSGPCSSGVSPVSKLSLLSQARKAPILLFWSAIGAFLASEAQKHRLRKNAARDTGKHTPKIRSDCNTPDRPLMGSYKHREISISFQLAVDIIDVHSPPTRGRFSQRICTHVDLTQPYRCNLRPFPAGRIDDDRSAPDSRFRARRPHSIARAVRPPGRSRRTRVRSLGVERNHHDDQNFFDNSPDNRYFSRRVPGNDPPGEYPYPPPSSKTMKL